MSDSQNSGKEIKKVSIATEKKEQLTKTSDSGPEATQRAVRTEIPPDVGTIEISTGIEQILPSEAREKASETNGMSARQAAIKRKQAATAKRNRLMASNPLPKTMVKDIKKHLYKEQKQLKREERKLKKIGAKAACKLTLIVRRLREIHQLIETIANLAYDSLKRLWLRVVHGIV